MNELALFAGAGGGILGGHLLGWRTVCAVETSAYCARRLMQRQNEGHLSPFPIWDDVCTFDGRPWRGIVDVVSGGFPCTDISAAGKGAGIDGENSGLWREMARIIGEVRPRYVFVENSPLLVSGGLARVLGDLAKVGDDARWGVMGAHHAGAPHKRDRVWIVAHTDEERRDRGARVQRQRWGHKSENSSEGVADPERDRLQGGEHPQPRQGEAPVRQRSADQDSQDVPDADSNGRNQGGECFAETWGDGVVGNDWWELEPSMGRVAHGVAHRVDRLRAIGNGQVPAVAAAAWRILSGD